jgi:hypothetical protein
VGCGDAEKKNEKCFVSDRSDVKSSFVNRVARMDSLLPHDPTLIKSRNKKQLEHPQPVPNPMVSPYIR